MNTTLEIADLLRILPFAALFAGVGRVIVRGIRAEEVVADKHESSLRRIREVTQSVGYWPKLAIVLVSVSAGVKPPSGDSSKWTEDQRSEYRSNIVRHFKFQLSAFSPSLEDMAAEITIIESAKRHGSDLKSSFQAQAIAVAVGVIPALYVGTAFLWPDLIDWVSLGHWFFTVAIMLASASITAYLIYVSREIRIGRDIARALSGLPDVPAGATS